MFAENERATLSVVIARLDRATQYSRDACRSLVVRRCYSHRAERTIDSPPYPYVKHVQMMDAHHMTFADATFDCVVAQFVITLVENPEQVLSECHRVVKPGGRIILVNHLFSETGERRRTTRPRWCIGGMSRHRPVMGIG